MDDFSGYRFDKTDVGKRIVNIRKSLKLSQPEFAELVELSTNFLSQVENGNKGLSSESVARISIRTGYSTDYILLGKTGASCVSPDNRELIMTYLLDSINLLKEL